METPDVPHALRMLEPTKTEGSISMDDASYFLSKIDLVKGDEPGMPAWRTNLFVATSHLSADAAEFFCLPPDRTLIMGSRIEV
jgi:KUP system potassium uptake protein